MRIIDSFLNNITMYRLLVWGLALLAAWALLMSLVGQLSYDPLQMLASLAALLAACFAANAFFVRIFKAPANIESWIITALILFFTLAPFVSGLSVLWLIVAGIVAMASKFVLAIKKRHLFNPAAFALFALNVAGVGAATWWVGSPAMLPAVLVLGFLVVRKVRRFDTFLSFAAASTALFLLSAAIDRMPLFDSFVSLMLSWPLFFLGTIMLTEPLTMPPSRPLRLVYGGMVGALFAMQFHIGPVYSTPELALLMGNLFSFIAGSRQRLMLTLSRVAELSPGIFEFAFSPNERLKFQAGQYLEWTLPHKSADSRGNRRYFTVSSSPSSSEVLVATRIGEQPSSFKRALKEMKPGDMLTATSLAGDFTLPRSAAQPLVFIAGGIGITPFASMLRHLLEVKEPRDIALVYAANSETDFAYRDLIEEARAKLNIKVEYLAGERVSEETVKKLVSDLSTPLFYLSGPDMMVRTYKKMLRGMGVRARRIKSDYFPGL